MIATPLSQIKLSPGGAMTVLGLTWKTYEALLQELGEDRLTRIAYDQGALEIRMPGELHEVVNRLLAKIITLLAMELGLEANDFGSVTLNREDLNRGVEPDSCFYIQNAEKGQGMLASSPQTLSPDLVVEVDIASSSANKMAIYQVMEVTEVWLFQQGRLTIQHLQNGCYQNCSNSHAFPMISAEQLNDWLELRKTETDLTVLKEVQRFCRANN